MTANFAKPIVRIPEISFATMHYAVPEGSSCRRIRLTKFMGPIKLASQQPQASQGHRPKFACVEFIDCSCGYCASWFIGKPWHRRGFDDGGDRSGQV
jgi:hypothetical protein